MQLHCEGHEDELDGSNADSEGEEQGTQDDEGELGAWGYVMPVQDDVDDDERSDRDDTNDSDEEDPDRVVPDEGDELDDDVYAREGYGAL